MVRCYKSQARRNAGVRARWGVWRTPWRACGVCGAAGVCAVNWLAHRGARRGGRVVWRGGRGVRRENARTPWRTPWRSRGTCGGRVCGETGLDAETPATVLAVAGVWFEVVSGLLLHGVG